MKKVASPGIQIAHHRFVSTMLFDDDEDIFKNIENKLQLATHRLNQL